MTLDDLPTVGSQSDISMKGFERVVLRLSQISFLCDLVILKSNISNDLQEGQLGRVSEQPALREEK